MLWIPSAFAHPGYPTHIYGPVLAFILTFVFPYVFVAYYPAHHFFKIPVQGFPGFFAYLTPVVAALTLAGAVAFWSFNLRRYQSSGR
jgi:ABC-2 type transport system permease protein